ncbi:MAG TPA: hypothetical protein VII00_08565 [bacterium]
MTERIKPAIPGISYSYSKVAGTERKDRKSTFQKAIDGGKATLSATAGAVLPAIALSAPPTVGGAVLTAFVAGSSKLGEKKEQMLSETGFSTGNNITWQDKGMQYLMMQMEIQDETRRFTTLSNIIKARHDAAMSAIRNLRA